MAAFNVPEEVDEFLTLGFLILFVISFMLNTYQSSEIVLDFAEYCYQVVPDETYEIDYLRGPNLEGYMTEYANLSLRNSKYAFGVLNFLYWFCIPYLCFFYAIYRFKPEMYENNRKVLKESNIEQINGVSKKWQD